MEIEPNEALYIGAGSPEERIRWFNEAFSDKALLRHAVRSRRGAKIEDPWLNGTWPSRLELANNFQGLITLEEFNARYAPSHTLLNTPDETHTKAGIYASQSAPGDLLRSILLGRADLVVKVTPLYRVGWDNEPIVNDKKLEYIDDEDLSEVFNDIRVAHFLRELLFGYRSIISLHFTQVIDWFPLSIPITRTISKKAVGLIGHYQVSIIERLDDTLSAIMDRDEPISLDELRVVLFQVFSALEVAWLTHRFVHYDLHLDNVMVKDLTSSKSPLNGRHWLYRRYNDPTHWYILPRELHRGRLIKLIDYGRAHLRVPCGPDACVYPDRHIHSCYFTPSDDFEHHGYGGTNPLNPYYDVRIFFYHLLSSGDNLALSYYDEDDKTMSPFLDLVKEALGLRHLRDELVTQARDSTDDNDKLEDISRFGDTLSLTVLKRSYVMQRILCNEIRTSERFGLTPSQVLDHAFFAPLRRDGLTEPGVTRTRDVNMITDDHVVVSFVDNRHELEHDPDIDTPPLEDLPFGAKETKSATLPDHARCHCGRAAPFFADTILIVSFCSQICYDFHYCFGLSTVDPMQLLS